MHMVIIVAVILIMIIGLLSSNNSADIKSKIDEEDKFLEEMLFSGMLDADW